MEAEPEALSADEPAGGGPPRPPSVYHPELVFALVGAVGTELRKVEDILRDRLSAFNYSVDTIRITGDVLPFIAPPANYDAKDELARITALMDAGNEARVRSKDNAILAKGAVSRISYRRPKDKDGKPSARQRVAYIIHSLKHPEEAYCLRGVYPQGFFLLGVYSGADSRARYLAEDKRISDKAAVQQLIARDEHETARHGQRVRDTFHLSDFFVRADSGDNSLKNSVWRILDLIFGHPYTTPTFDEYAMFLAFAASLRSADLSRQVGAVIARDNQVLATGANDCPAFGGGLYWPQYDKGHGKIVDQEGGRDYKRGRDANKEQQERLITEICETAGEVHIDRDVLKQVLKTSGIGDLTEFGRVVHAEMDALLACGRCGVSTKGGSLFCTTFPCHNCAKHLVAAGLNRVVYIEPYPKSKAFDLHPDSIVDGFNNTTPGVQFEPFVGIGPRRFFDLFSMKLGSGYHLKRSDDEGHVLSWEPERSTPRLRMLPYSYLEAELDACSVFDKLAIQVKG